MFQSILEILKSIRALFTDEMWKDPFEALLNIHEDSGTAKNVFNTAQRPQFWVVLTSIAPLFNIFSVVVAFLESDICPLSIVLMSFSF